MNAGVQVYDVWAGYNGLDVLREVNLTVQPGTLTALLGPSGCGKSTLLRVIAGFLQPGAGEVHVAGRLVAGPGTSVPPERRRVGIVPQEGALFPHLDVAGNIGFGLRRRHRSARVAELLELIGLPDAGKARPHELSGGMAQRVALARALAPSPDVVLLDEPFSALDVSLRASVRAEVLGTLRACGATAVLVTHDQEEALSAADEVAVMRGGTIAAAAAPQTIYDHPPDADLAVFLGDCNLLTAERAATGSLTSALGQLPPTVPFDVAAGVAMLRPEHLHATTRPGAGATVVNSTYQGHDVLLDIRLASGVNVTSRMLSGTATPKPGDSVELAVVGV